MKKIFLMLAMVGVCDSFAQDTIQIELNDKAKVVVTAQDRESLKKLKDINFNKVIKGAISKIDTTFSYKEEKERKSLILFGTDFEFSDEDGIINIGTENKDKKKRSIQTGWIVDLGLNNYLQKNGNFPDANNEPYRLQTANSVYVGVGKMWYFRIGNEKSPVWVRTGIMADWYNFRFVPQNYLKLDSTGSSITFGNYNQEFSKQLTKSKLVVPYIQIPLTLKFSVPISEKVRLKAGIGGYVAIRTGGRTKLNIGEEKIKEKDSYYLNTWRYGLEGNIGINNFVLFAKYDLNPLFAEGRGPALNPISFGIRL
jgi:Outer membrane protein beta-barrel domain